MANYFMSSAISCGSGWSKLIFFRFSFFKCRYGKRQNIDHRPHGHFTGSQIEGYIAFSEKRLPGFHQAMFGETKTRPGVGLWDEVSSTSITQFRCAGIHVVLMGRPFPSYDSLSFISSPYLVSRCFDSVLNLGLLSSRTCPVSRRNGAIRPKSHILTSPYLFEISAEIYLSQTRYPDRQNSMMEGCS